MSFADPDLADLTLPVPENVTEGLTGKRRHIITTGHRAFQRLQEQERVLSRRADSKKETTDEPTGWRVVRRSPVGSAVNTVKARIPAALKSFSRSLDSSTEPSSLQKNCYPASDRISDEKAARHSENYERAANCWAFLLFC
eukprot:RCo003672